MRKCFKDGEMVRGADATRISVFFIAKKDDLPGRSQKYRCSGRGLEGQVTHGAALGTGGLARPELTASLKEHQIGKPRLLIGSKTAWGFVHYASQWRSNTEMQ